ncbi:MAG: hypothetical protein Q9167_005236 [Letrouitia subvulpina]
MAPITLDAVDDHLKNTIQLLFQLQSATHGYLGSATHSELLRLIPQLSSSLSALSSTASHIQTQIPPEVVQYVDEGRNPDIYTREFVELVVKGNQYLKGKGEAFAGFRDLLAEEMRMAWPDMEGEIEGVVGSGNGLEGKEGREGETEVKRENGGTS